MGGARVSILPALTRRFFRCFVRMPEAPSKSKDKVTEMACCLAAASPGGGGGGGGVI